MTQISKVSLSRGVNAADLSSGSVQCRPRAGNSSPRLSNLDLRGTLVKRMRLVSWHGRRGIVRRVSRGRCLVQFIDIKGGFVGFPEWCVCESVQVVA